MNFKDLVKVANRLDSLGLTGEADALDRIIAEGIRKEAGPQGTASGPTSSAASQVSGPTDTPLKQSPKWIAEQKRREESKSKQVSPQGGVNAFQHSTSKLPAQNKAAVEKEMNKTMGWFNNVVFPGIENNMWPIVADQDYLIAPNPDLFSSTSASYNQAWDGRGIKILRGSSFSGLDGVNALVKSHPKDPDMPPYKLETIYSIFEKAVDSYDLSVPVQSFPD